MALALPSLGREYGKYGRTVGGHVLGRCAKGKKASW